MSTSNLALQQEVEGVLILAPFGVSLHLDVPDLENRDLKDLQSMCPQELDEFMDFHGLQTVVAFNDQRAIRFRKGSLIPDIVDRGLYDYDFVTFCGVGFVYRLH